MIFENDYKTLNVEYMESVIWAFRLSTGPGWPPVWGASPRYTLLVPD